VLPVTGEQYCALVLGPACDGSGAGKLCIIAAALLALFFAAFFALLTFCFS
jgi:hypothetical protein